MSFWQENKSFPTFIYCSLNIIPVQLTFARKRYPYLISVFNDESLGVLVQVPSSSFALRECHPWVRSFFDRWLFFGHRRKRDIKAYSEYFFQFFDFIEFVSSVSEWSGMIFPVLMNKRKSEKLMVNACENWIRIFNKNTIKCTKLQQLFWPKYIAMLNILWFLFEKFLFIKTLALSMPSD